MKKWPSTLQFLHAFAATPCTHTHTDTVLTAIIFLSEPVLAGWPLILLFHLFLDCTSFWNRPKLSMSSLTQSHQVFFRCPLCNSSNFQCHTQSSLCSPRPKPSHPTLLIIKLTGSNPNSFASFSLFFLSFSVTPHIHLPILTSVRLKFTSCSAFIGQVTLHYIKHLTQAAHTSPFGFNKNPFLITMGK